MLPVLIAVVSYTVVVVVVDLVVVAAATAGCCYSAQNSNSNNNEKLQNSHTSLVVGRKMYKINKLKKKTTIAARVCLHCFCNCGNC